MTEQELLDFIESVEQEELHPAPDYLKEIILWKADSTPKSTQLIIYSLKTLAATAAALIILFTLPQSTFISESIRLQETMQIQEKKIQIQETMQLQEEKMQEQIKKEREQMTKKMLNNIERISITDYLNRGSSYICNQILTIFDTEN